MQEQEYLDFVDRAKNTIEQWENSAWLGQSFSLKIKSILLSIPETLFPYFVPPKVQVSGKFVNQLCIWNMISPNLT